MTQTQRVFADRVFSVATGDSTELAWYCLTREHILGPYPKEQLARVALTEFVDWCQRVGWTGDREEVKVVVAELLNRMEYSEAA